MPRSAVALALAVSFDLGAARAAPWECPEEISVAGAYNKLYRTKYDVTDSDGLAKLVKDHGTQHPPAWNIDLLRSIRVLAVDTNAEPVLSIEVIGGKTIMLYATGPWTPPTRGWLPGGGDMIDLEEVLSDNGYDPEGVSWNLIIEGAVVDANNAWLIAGEKTGESLLGFNHWGVHGTDADANEPLLQLFAWYTEPQPRNLEAPRERIDHRVAAGGFRFFEPRPD